MPRHPPNQSLLLIDPSYHSRAEPQAYNPAVSPLGALSQAWTSAEASLPLGWRLSGLHRFEDLWIGPAEGPAFEDCASGSGQYAEQALRQLSDRLRERRGLT
jgi:hypothetical protein